MRFAIVAVLVVVLLVLAAGASLFLFSSSSRMVVLAPVTVSSSSTAIDGSPDDVSPSIGSVGAKIWRDGKRVLFEFDDSSVEIELGAEDGTFDFTKFGEHLTTLDRQS